MNDDNDLVKMYKLLAHIVVVNVYLNKGIASIDCNDTNLKDSLAEFLKKLEEKDKNNVKKNFYEQLNKLKVDTSKDKEIVKKIINEFIRHSNNIDFIESHAIRDEYRALLIKLTELHILPSCLSQPRAYFTQMAYWRKSDKGDQKKFIYKALEYLCKDEYNKKYDDEKLEKFKEDIEKFFRDFSLLRLNSGWKIKTKGLNKKENEPEKEDPSESALELARILTRLFFAESLTFELLDIYQKQEKILFSFSSKYRDHFIHVIYVFLMGCRILEGLMPEIRRNWIKYSGENISNSDLYIRTMRTWLIASLFHDVGYVAESLKYLQKTLQEEFFNHVPGFTLSHIHLKRDKYIEDEVKNLLMRISRVIRENEFSFTKESSNESDESVFKDQTVVLTSLTALFQDQLQIEDLDHGVASALFLLLTLHLDLHEIGLKFEKKEMCDAYYLYTYNSRHEEYLKKRKEIQEDIAVACAAMALHNIRQTTYKSLSVKFTEHPIAFLLSLCDQLQEWDRTSESVKPKDAFKAIYGFNVFQKTNDKKALLTEYYEKHVDTVKIKKDETYSQYLQKRIYIEIEKKEKVIKIINDEIVREFSLYCESYSEFRERYKKNAKKLLYCDLLHMQINNDVITLTYIGGDKDRGDATRERLNKIRKEIAEMFSRNLTEGPAILLLHGFDHDDVTVFYAAEYNYEKREYEEIEGVKENYEKYLNKKNKREAKEKSADRHHRSAAIT
ncbi:MAG: hypothetical protein GX444_20985 [Myxococcales bacterium]|nr:hypothetical protein [Myxococcales bacterium]